MKVQRLRSVGFSAATYLMLLLSGKFTAASVGCLSMYVGDGDCDDNNNKEECGAFG